MTLRRAVPHDAAALSAFGRRVYYATFAADNRPHDMAAYLDVAYSEERQRREIEDPAIDTILMEEAGTLTAFAQLRSGESPACVTGARPLELWRFYVDPAWHGRGAAPALMEAVQRRARERAARTLWLGVWEKNARAQAFYRKHGFAVAGSQTFMMGSDAQRDLVMVTSL